MTGAGSVAAQPAVKWDLARGGGVAAAAAATLPPIARRSIRLLADAVNASFVPGEYKPFTLL